MSMLAAWGLFPLVLLALCCGLGLLVDALSGRRLPGALVAPVGLAAIVVVGQFTTLGETTAELTVALLAFLAVLGAGLSFPWRFGRLEGLAVVAALAVFAVFAAPVVLSGEPTFAGYARLDDTATWLALTDRVMEHGHSLAGLEPSTYRAALEANLSAGNPVGVLLPFGAAQKLSGGDLAWVFQPYLAFLAAMLSLALWEILAGVIRRPGPRAFAVFVVAQPALLFGYALVGGVRELGAAVFVALAAAATWPLLRSRGVVPARRDVAPLTLAVAALVGVVGLGGLIWTAPLLLALAVLGVSRFGRRATAGRVLAFAALLALLVIPAIPSGLTGPSSSPLTDPDGEGGLHGALNALQVLGIWPAGDFRSDPSATVASAVLIALVAAAAGAGLWVAWARRKTTLLLYCATSLLACAAIVLLGSPWAGGEALAIASPAVLSLALLGAAAALRVDRLTGAVLVAVVAGGVLWSNVLAYGGANLAPYAQLSELERVGEDFAGQGPALMTEYNPYGARHFLRRLDAEGASELRMRELPLRGGGEPAKGAAVDTDELETSGLYAYRTLVLRRSPLRSRPPSPYRLVWAGDYYEVWQRPEAPTGLPPEHQPFGDSRDPAAVPSCSEVVGLGQLALIHGAKYVRLLAARHAPVFNAAGGSLRLPRTGAYTAWLGGSVRGSVELLVDGRQIGEARHQLEYDGGFIRLGSARLAEGLHRVELRFGGADLHPGSGGFPRPETGPLLFSPAGGEGGEIVSADIGESRRLCGRPWDWIDSAGVP